MDVLISSEVKSREIGTSLSLELSVRGVVFRSKSISKIYSCFVAIKNGHFPRKVEGFLLLLSFCATAVNN